MEYTTFELRNGLRVMHSREEATAMVATNLIYDVGARNESAGRTGLAHLFEHLMCGPSANVADPDGVTERAGGQFNAWTSNDYTNFMFLLPAQNVETSFWIESNRMLSPTLTGQQLEVQRGVVIEEFKERCLNQPYGDRSHHLRRLLYTTHPYRWPTIGLTPDHVRYASEQDVTDFFDRNYSPDRAVLVVTGNISADRVRRLAEDYFGDIPAHDTAGRTWKPEPQWTGERRTRVYGNVPQAMLTLAFPMAGCYEPGYAEADLITDLLAAGRGSRLYSALLGPGSEIIGADASIIGSNEPGELMVTVKLADSSDETIARAEQRVREQLERLTREPVSEREMQRVHNRYESNVLFSNMNIVQRGTEMALAAIQGHDPDDLLRDVRAVTPESIRHTATELFSRGGCAVLEYLPEPEQA